MSTTFQPWDAYLLYTAVSLHFDSDSYDAFRYNFRTSAKPASFNLRKDRFFFAKLAKKYPSRSEFQDFLVANFSVADSKLWSGRLVEDTAERNFTEWKRKMEAWSYNFKEDVDRIATFSEEKKIPFNAIFTSIDGAHPPVVALQTQGKISLETLTAMDLIMGFMAEAKVTETIFWPNYSKKVHKYRAFLRQKIDLGDARKAIISRFTTG